MARQNTDASSAFAKKAHLSDQHATAIHSPIHRRNGAQTCKKAASGCPAQTDGVPAGAFDLPGIRDNHAHR
jgi:hypothetical protein